MPKTHFGSVQFPDWLRPIAQAGENLLIRDSEKVLHDFLAFQNLMKEPYGWHVTPYEVFMKKTQTIKTGSTAVERSRTSRN